jgi:phenylacetate-CoA ligase
MAAMYRGHLWHGLDIGAKEAMLWGVPVNFGQRQKTRVRDFLLNRFRESEYNLKAHVLKDFYNKMVRKKPAYLMGYSSMVYEFARFLREEGLDGRRLGLKLVKCTSETIQEVYRETINEVFGCNIVSEYGAAETGLIAFECDRGNHHLLLDCTFVHFVEQDMLANGVPTKKILVTDLHNYAVPVINYEVGDSVVTSQHTCPCGRPFPLLEQIIGRLGDVVLTPDGQRLHSIIFYYIMKGLTDKGGGIKSFKVHQKDKDRLKVLLVKDKGFTQKSLEFLSREFQRHFGPEMHVDFEFCDAIPREQSGKLRDFVQEMQL